MMIMVIVKMMLRIKLGMMTVIIMLLLQLLLMMMMMIIDVLVRMIKG